ncbi:MAG TPA: energy transducer TonB [Flavobacteriaceae bacterium]|nr:energy transducer TonB [Flavobacteriaceae bacterium]
MQIKKYAHARLENYSKVLVLLGLVLALFLVYEFINYKSFPKSIKQLTATPINIEEEEQNVEIAPIEIETPQVTKTVLLDKIVQVEDEVEIKEAIIKSTETDENEAIIVAEKIAEDIVEVEEEEEVVEDVPFIVIEDVPVYPGCVGNKDELRSCFANKISKFVLSKFKSSLASDLGLEPGSIQKIFVIFKISKTGEVTHIKARAPHKALEKEAIRVIGLLPQMTPGKQRGKAVSVSYSLPIVFQVQ